MILKLWTRKAVSACVVFAILTTTSMVALAASDRIAAELTVSGKNVNGEAPTVLVNGETSKSGRSIFSSSTVETPSEAAATISVGKAGRLQLDPGSTVTLYFDDASIDVEMTAGRLTVLGSLGTVKVRTNDGKSTDLGSGESITASGATKAKQTGGGNDDWVIWVLIAGGAAAALLLALSQSNNNGNVVSPNR